MNVRRPGPFDHPVVTAVADHTAGFICVKLWVLNLNSANTIVLLKHVTCDHERETLTAERMSL